MRIIKGKGSFFILFIISILFLLVAFSTHYYGHIDTVEYIGVAKYFAGEYKADLRSSHSLSYGFLNAPFISFFGSILGMKIFNIIVMALIILSLYYLSQKDKRVLILFLLSPLFWYSGPWIGPLQLSTLLFLWGFSLLEKWNKNARLSYLAWAGVFIGLSWVFWNTILFLVFFLFFCYFLDKKGYEILIFAFFLFLGLLPLLIFDYMLYNFPLYSILKNLIGILTALQYGSIYPGVNQVANSLIDMIAFLLLIPFFSFTFFKKEFILRYKKGVAFISIALLFFLLNAQARYLLIVWPILLLYLVKSLDKKKFLIQACIFAILSLLVINPYLIQIKYDTNSPEFTSLLTNAGKWNISEERFESLINADLKDLEKDYPNQSFIVGNRADDYAVLAVIYSGKEVKEFVSIQDYSLFKENKTALFEKKLIFEPNIRDRRRIWIGGGLEKAEDLTDYSSLEYGIGVGSPLNLTGFDSVKTYRVLHISQKR